MITIISLISLCDKVLYRKRKKLLDQFLFSKTHLLKRTNLKLKNLHLLFRYDFIRILVISVESISRVERKTKKKNFYKFDIIYRAL